MHVVGVAAELGHHLPPGDVDEADGAVAAAGSQSRAVGAEGHAVDLAAHGNRRELPVRRDVPEAHRQIEGAGSQKRTVCAVDNARNCVGVSAQVRLLAGA